MTRPASRPPSGPKRSLRPVSTGVLLQVREALARGTLAAPVHRAGLLSLGIKEPAHHEALETCLSGHKTHACLAILDAVLAERAFRRPPPELVWTGPEAPLGTARDTAVVLRELFESARENVILAGYHFDHAQDVLEPLYRSMKGHGVEAFFFVEIDQIKPGVKPDDHLKAQLGGFLRDNWPFGEPRPRIHYDKRSLKPGPPWCSLHAKCLVVDGRRAFVSSANFTQRGQERNIEVGVLVEDAGFARSLAGQWMGLVGGQLAGEYGG